MWHDGVVEFTRERDVEGQRFVQTHVRIETLETFPFPLGVSLDVAFDANGYGGGIDCKGVENEGKPYLMEYIFKRHLCKLQSDRVLRAYDVDKDQIIMHKRANHSKTSTVDQINTPHDLKDPILQERKDKKQKDEKDKKQKEHHNKKDKKQKDKKKKDMKEEDRRKKKKQNDQQKAQQKDKSQKDNRGKKKKKQ